MLAKDFMIQNSYFIVEKHILMEEIKVAIFITLLIIFLLAYLLIYPETKNAKDYPSKTWEKDLLLKEYEILNHEIERREGKHDEFLRSGR